ncbi:hypothetical protein JCM19235_4331 [Vibrio maritimus]|uniref:Uncharacterized protein n=1 Tax=Vibrio maritimus TaxID=990268 RepID=A0A090RXY2_9VIBR|nr:hypothetical protein JCM19235_4331 [Vibrio maritimus]
MKWWQDLILQPKELRTITAKQKSHPIGWQMNRSKVLS